MELIAPPNPSVGMVLPFGSTDAIINDNPVPAATPVRGIPLDGPGVGAGFVTVRAEVPTGISISVDVRMLVGLVEKIVGDWPPTCIVAPLINPEPVTVNRVGFPARRLDGATEETTGGGFWSVNGTTFEAPADGTGF